MRERYSTSRQQQERFKRQPSVSPVSRRIALLLLALLITVPVLPASAAPAPSPAQPPITNPGFECFDSYHPQDGIRGLVPNGWTAVLLNGDPELNSTRFRFTYTCDYDGFVERLEGWDSLAFLSEDIETPPLPGKPFDATIYQRVPVTPGEDYSLSGWLVSFCGGNATPNDCPSSYYIAKLLGIDPTGGTNPNAASVHWVEDRRNFTESGWANLRQGVTAQSNYVTLFVRVNSPFRWHGAHAFADAISLVQAPDAWFNDLPANASGSSVLVKWTGSQSSDITAIPGGTYQLMFDVQYRLAGQTAWTDWQTGQPAGHATFTVDPCLGAQTVQFRLRARSEQPPGSGGAWPNHRYPGPWSAPVEVRFQGSASCHPAAFLPMVTLR